jgi:carboxyl-terminal processing protease
MLKAFKYMTNMKRLPILVLMIAAGIFLAFQSFGNNDKFPPSNYEKILHNVGDLLIGGHYSPQDVNDAFSKSIFKKYLEELDGNKNIFLQADISSLKKYETRIDDEIKGDKVEFFLVAGNLFNKRMEEASAYYTDILSRPFDFNINEKIVTDSKKLNFPENEMARKEAWRKRLKYLVLDRYTDMIDAREKNKGQKDFVYKSDEELEKEARDKVMKVMDRTFERYRFKFSDDDKFNIFVNAITSAMDPHTNFFPPVDKRYFDEQLSGSFFGIGASLIYDEGNIKINTLVAGSPAWKSGEIQVGDIITKVAQGKEEPVELTGFLVEDAVKLIRGAKGTIVKLTFKKQDGSEKIVTLIRDKIVQDETYARSAIVKNGSSKIGYIFLPEFYADFEDPKGPRCAVDVAREIVKLKSEKIDGLVIDLRNNGGGSLMDVVQMAGLFIEDGPIVQVKSRGELRPTILRDRDKSILYDGPLVVMINEFSASASEIFAAAIQDYKRGVIVGSTSTYGKGTVQRNIGLDPQSNLFNSNSELGTVKLTLQKFYRINGGSTQLKGVYSDIVIPDNYEYLKFREKDNPEALPWDEIEKAPFNVWKSDFDMNAIQQSSKQRIDNNQAFQLIRENTEWLSKQNEEELSLQMDKFRETQKKLRTTFKQIESLNKLPNELKVSFPTQDVNRFSNDKDKQARFNQWLKNLGNDIYLDQAVKVAEDIISQKNLAMEIQKKK